MELEDPKSGRGPRRGAGVPFGRYLIRRRIARGGMGEVFLADQLGPRGPVRPVALKRMLPRLAAEPRLSTMFLDEMATAAQLNHANIATTYDFGEVDGMYFLAMEFVEGLTMRQLLSRLGALPVGACLDIAASIAEALAHAHEPRGQAPPVVHRDVSPHNVMVSERGAVKLLDFGIARAEAAVLGGRVEGKVAYAAPEQLRAEAVDRRTDLWALGVLLYEALTGVVPFPQGNGPRVLEAATQGAYRPVGQLRPQAAVAEDLVARALAADPDDRWSSAEQFGQACRQTLTRLEASPPDIGALVTEAGGALVHTAGEDLGAGTETGVAMGPSAGTETGVSMGSSAATLRATSSPGSAPAAANDTLIVPHPARPPRSRPDTLLQPAPRRRVNRALVIAPVAVVLVLGLLAFWWPDDRDPGAVTGSKAPSVQAAPGSSDPPDPAAPPSAAAPAAGTPTSPTPAAVPALAAPANSPDAGTVDAAVRPQRRARRASAARRRRTRPRRSRKPRRRSPPVVTRPSAGSVPAKPAKVVPAPAPAKIALRSVPWSRVEIDGKSIGTTPIVGRELPPGRHRVRLIPGQGAFEPRTTTIEARPGVTVRVLADFRTGKVDVR